jgi:EAL and modified HD-GYP domain-containing signal transduction protein
MLGASSEQAGQKPAEAAEAADSREAQLPAADKGAVHIDAPREGILHREAVLDEGKGVVGYRFLLRESAYRHVRRQGLSFAHLCAGILANNLASAQIGELIGHRRLFIRMPDTFLDSPAISSLPLAQATIVLEHLPEAGEIDKEKLVAAIEALHAQGAKIGIPDPSKHPEWSAFLPFSDVVLFRESETNAAQAMRLFQSVNKMAPKAEIAVGELEDRVAFEAYRKMGAKLFSGPFSMRRERWQAKKLGANIAHLTLLLDKLRQDADTADVVSLLKQDGALTLHLLRYINSAANGLQQHVSSIEHALALLGRSALKRWLMLLLCAQDSGQPRNSAVFEAALVRARTMELLAAARPAAERDALFLAGLLSLIDVILQQPLAHVLEALPIDANISLALLEGKGPYATVLELAQACENMDQGAIEAAGKVLGIRAEEAVQRHLEALSWAVKLQEDDAAAAGGAGQGTQKQT